MSPQPGAPIPQVFVLWHPDYRYGKLLARRILQWLRPGNGLGPEVFYRSLPGSGLIRLPLSLPDPTQKPSSGQKRVSNLQVVIVLAEEHMVADRSWRHWLEELGASSRNRSIMPVALDATAYNMPATLRERNYLRPAGPPLSADPPVEDAAYEAVARSLLKQLTEAMCRLILPRPTRSTPGQDPNRAATDDAARGPHVAGENDRTERETSNDPLPKVNVFLSHAKKDGTVPARRLRDYIYGQTQLAAFFDENDIAFGDVFSRVIQDAVQSTDTAAMIAVRSAAYASRPWCRRELSLFRTPQEVSPKGATREQWRLYPAMVVEAMEGRDLSSGIPEIGSSTSIRWTDNDPGLEELIVTTVIRDAMLASFHSALGASIPHGGTEKQIVINWLPDPTTLLRIESVQSGEGRVVLHPGRGLTGLELDILYEFFPHLTFRSFEEALLS